MSYLNVIVLDGKPCEVNLPMGDRSLSFMFCEWNLDDDGSYFVESGYKYAWREEGTGKVLAHRAGARIPSFADMMLLQNKAIEAGWAIRAEDRYKLGTYTTCSYADSFNIIRKNQI